MIQPRIPIIPESQSMIQVSRQRQEKNHGNRWRIPGSRPIIKLSQPTMRQSRPMIPGSQINKIGGRPRLPGSRPTLFWNFGGLLALALFKDLTDQVCQYFQIPLGAAKLTKIYNKHCWLSECLISHATYRFGSYSRSRPVTFFSWAAGSLPMTIFLGLPPHFPSGETVM